MLVGRVKNPELSYVLAKFPRNLLAIILSLLQKACFIHGDSLLGIKS